MHVARQSIELRNDELRADEPAQPQSFLQLRSVGLLAALDLHELLDERPVATIQPVRNRLALSLQTQPRTALARCGNPQVGDKLALIMCKANRGRFQL